jgi:mRNA-degrading endonuclease RelE of RelBE toxin-antitoxin system
MYNLIIQPTADRAFKKLAKKDKGQLTRIEKKIQQILEDPYRFKPMRFPLDGCRRVQVGSFVILFEIDESTTTVTILDYDHHDNVYQK